ncbi:MAG TPA: DOMON-like domain-containing protein [Steroidobacteraceae bacterium]|nr:DOMON-like domain-containing protein [Steroidobacteraceae bacterium]
MKQGNIGASALVAHPDTPVRAVSSVICVYEWFDPGEWRFNFLVTAPRKALKLPAPAAPARTDGLWRHTCFELFLRDPADGAYLEFNFSPSGQWAAYEFDGYRAGMRPLEMDAPLINPGGSEAEGFGLSALLRQPGLWRALPVRVGISAVIEEADGTTSYWALAHPPGKPDFHHADSFALELKPQQ